MATNWYSAFHEIAKNEIKDNEYKLLGEFEVNDEEYKNLLLYTRQFVKSSTDLNSPKANLLVALTLVQIAIRCYREGNYWSYLNRELDEEIPSTRQQYLGKVFYKTIRLFGMFEIAHEEHEAIHYVENIKAHAFVTNHYLEGFYDFTYAFYENNLFRQLPDTEIELFEDIEALSEFMKNSLHSNSNVIENGEGETKAAKSYRLLKATRNVFAECSPKNINHLYYPILKMLDQYYYDGSIESVRDSRFKSAFLAWCEKENQTETGKSRNKAERKFRNRKPYINVDIENERVYLTIPAQKFRIQDCENGVYATVEINGHTVEKKLELWNSFGIYISEPLSLPIPSLFDEIVISFSTPDEKSYTLRHRNYRFFNERFEMIEKPVNGNNYVLFKKGQTVDCSQENIIEYSKEYRHWDYLNIKVNKDSLFAIGKHVFTIIGEYNTVPVFEDEITHFELENQNGEKQLVTYTHPYFSFDVEKRKLGGTVLFINGKPYPVKNLPAGNISDSPISSDFYAVNVQLSDLIEKIDGKYSISIDIPGENTKKICEYVLLRDFRAGRKHKYLIFNETFEVHVKSRYHKLSILDSWETMHFNEASGYTYYEIPTEEYKEYVRFSLSIGDDEGEHEPFILKLPVNMLAYGFEKEKLTHKRESYIWHRNVGENLYVKFPGTEKVWAFLNNDRDNLKEAVMLEPGLFQIDISEFRQKITENTEERWQYINLSFNKVGKRSTYIPPILRKMDINPYYTLMYSEENGVHMKLKIQGEDDVLVTIKDHYTGELLVEKRLLRGGLINFPELSPKGCYDITPYISEVGAFGFFRNEEEKKTLTAMRCYEEGSLVNCSAKITKILNNNKELKLEGTFFIEFREKIDDNTYTAQMYCKRMIGDKMRDTKRDKYGEFRIILTENDDIYSARMQNYSVSEGAWMFPYYDKQKHDLVRYDNPMLMESQSSSKLRFLMLDDEETEIVIKKTNIRRK